MTSQIQPRTPPSSSASIPQGRIVSSVRHSNSQHAVQAVVRAVLSTKWSAVSVSLHCDIIRRKEVESVDRFCMCVWFCLRFWCADVLIGSLKVDFGGLKLWVKERFSRSRKQNWNCSYFFLFYCIYIHLYDATPSVASVWSHSNGKSQLVCTI